ncbi:glycosyl transferase group 1 [Ferroglobus placidus DSM 10642]|uniref:Glycosyl transferase group 1 n=1 Tax=Ferroglobus placidus (strain DSM 10642 / AEDII12DO) TaxID=589924 RepID=D3RZ91_FERPA|nr:glycosyltransferase family 4 protein [Ferroglobus placidus]ADC65804.1 glycosyl transferase group 1 [Ferroglobus placidus DSM 10642]
MHIAVLSRWNATCGVAMHAELIVPEFLKMGHDVTVFAPYVESASRWWHHKVVRKDEDFVVRCYEEVSPEGEGGKINFDEILKRSFDVLLVESYGSVPHLEVQKLAGELKKKGIKTFVVIHEGYKKDLRYSDFSNFEKLAVFDERYVNELLNSVRDKTTVIPYPCHPLNPTKRKFAEDGLKFFSFGRQPINEYDPFFKALETLEKDYEFTYRVIRSNGELPYERKWLIQERKRLRDNREVYEELHKADIFMIPKGQTNGVVVSSTLYQCMGALIPTVVPNTRHFEMHEKEVVKFNDAKDLSEKIRRLIEDEKYRKSVVENAKKYVEENDSRKIAERFIKLFNEYS